MSTINILKLDDAAKLALALGLDITKIEADSFTITPLRSGRAFITWNGGVIVERDVLATFYTPTLLVDCDRTEPYFSGDKS